MTNRSTWSEDSCIHPILLRPFLLEAGILKESRIEGSNFYVMGIREYIDTAIGVAMKQMAAGEPPCWLREYCKKYNVDFKPAKEIISF